jgi:hypothetical protein
MKVCYPKVLKVKPPGTDVPFWRLFFHEGDSLATEGYKCELTV